MEEQIKLFLSSGSGDGYVDGSGYGSGSGDGYVDGSGYVDGYVDGTGYVYGDGSGSGSGYGDGSGSGDGIKTFNGDKVYIIDDIPTIIKHIHDNVAKGYILNDDFTLTKTFVAKENGKFAHGETLHDAFASLQEKLYDDSTEEERIEAFKKHFPDFTKKVSAKELFYWHHVLTGSCEQGRLSFCINKGIDIEKDSFTIYEFIELTKESYNGDIIKKLL